MILETFVTNKLYNNYLDNTNNTIQDKNTKYNNSFFDYCNEECQKYNKIHVIIALIFMTLTCVVAGILAWNCNAKESIVIRLINTFISIIFSDIYILYYLIYRVILKNKCY